MEANKIAEANIIAKCKILSKYKCPSSDRAHNEDQCPYAHNDINALELLPTETYILLAVEAEKYNYNHTRKCYGPNLSDKARTFEETIAEVMAKFK